MDFLPSPDFSTLSKQQQIAVGAYLNGENIFVTGGAGSGKSYLLGFLKRNFSNQGLEITASTGIAAVNISGSTIHSWSGIGLGNMPLEQIVANISSKKLSKVRRKILQTKALAIDEVSMISAETLTLLNRVFQAVRQNDKPMGGLQILFFGDFLQLPPVKKYGEEIDFCFQSQTWKNLNPRVFNLNEIFRQKDQQLVAMLNNLRLGKITQTDRDLLNSRLQAQDENLAIRPTILTTHNAKVEKINYDHLKNIVSKEIIHEAEFFGDEYKVEFLKKNCIAAQALKLKVGAQVMMIKNTFQKEGIINGSLGIIREFSPKKSYPIVEFSNGKILTISPEEWLIEKFDEENKTMKTEASLRQIPLLLAWAITIHKAQGLTLDKISCDLSDIFSAGQAYVALSRARSLDGIFIESINFEKISAHQDAKKYYEDFK